MDLYFVCVYVLQCDALLLFLQYFAVDGLPIPIAPVKLTQLREFSDIPLFYLKANRFYFSTDFLNNEKI